MANNHYSTKRNRRPKNKKRKDYTRETMLKLRELNTDPGSMLTVADLRRAVEILKKHAMPTVQGPDGPYFVFRPLS